MRLPELQSGTARGRRTLLLALVLFSTAIASYWMFDVVQNEQRSQAIKVLTTVLFTISFAWISCAFWTAIAGVLLRLFRRDPITLRPLRELGEISPQEFPLEQRTAIVMPVYNEDPERVFAGIEATYRSLAETGQLEQFDFFILSDTRSEERGAVEASAWRRLRARTGGRIYYRRRTENIGRKAGNLADFCTRWGRHYENMVVLDADSVMSGDTLVRLARIMQQNPGTALVQTLPIAVNRETFFARFIQFATRMNGPVLATGLTYWQLGEGNYWGHNAIIRVAPFMKHCGLPTLPGSAPFGGEILSHDFVEAALLLRAGWSVWMLPEVTGSYEEVPTNLVDCAKRDRRWCQGNLQHLKILGAAGLRPLSRVHLVLGVLAYLSPLLWCILLAISTFDIVQQAITGYDYFSAEPSLFPRWPIAKTMEQLSLYAVSMGLLLVPKLLSLLLVLLDRAERRSFGGTWRLLASTLAEIVFAALLAPVMMLFHASFVVSILLRRGVSWGAQDRTDRGLSWSESAARQWAHTTVGLIATLLIALLAPAYLIWMAPVLAGLLLSIPLSWLSSRADFGKLARRAGIFVTPEERAPPPVLRELEAALQRQHVPSVLAPDATEVWVPRELPGEMRPQALDRVPDRAPSWRPRPASRPPTLAG